MQRHVTYIRDTDRCRVVFVFGADPDGFTPPRGFRHAASCDFAGDGEFVVPADGDDFGNEPSAQQRRDWSPSFLNAMGRA